MDQADLTAGAVGIGISGRNRRGQMGGAGHAEVFAMELVACFQTGIDHFEGAASSIDAHDRACALFCSEVKSVLSIRQQRLHGGSRGGVAHKQTHTNRFVVPTGIDAPFLAARRPEMIREVAFGGVLGSLAALASGKVDVQPLELLGVIVPSGSAVLSKEGVDRLLHLGDIVVLASIKGVLHHGLFGASRFAEGFHERGIGPELGIDLDHAMGSGEQQDKGVGDLVNGRVLDGLLWDLQRLSDGSEQIDMVEILAEGGKTGASAEAGRSGRLGQGKGPPMMRVGALI